jgi:hypothetical protein
MPASCRHRSLANANVIPESSFLSFGKEPARSCERALMRLVLFLCDAEPLSSFLPRPQIEGARAI